MARNCIPDDQVLRALLTAAERIGARARSSYMKQIKRDRRGNIRQGYVLTEAHQRVMDTIDAYSRCKIDDESAMSVLHEYDVMRGRFGERRRRKR